MKKTIFLLAITLLIGLVSCEKNDYVPVQQEEAIEKSEATLKSTSLPRWIFDRVEATQYALLYTHDGMNDGDVWGAQYYNSSYKVTYVWDADRQEWMNYVDCANFVSQSMLDGRTNSAQVYGGNDASSWYYEDNNTSSTGDDYCSPSWSGANNQYEFFKNNYYTKRRSIYKSGTSSSTSLAFTLFTRELRLGDLIYFDWTNDGHIDHVMMVTRVDDGVFYVSGHTKNQKNDELRWVLQGMTSSGKATSVAF